MYSACGNAALPALGFPIRESTGQRLFNASPWLIAVVHALHRLLVPRHPPCALTILTVIGPDPRSGPVIPELIWPTMRFSRSEERDREGGRSLKTQQHVCAFPGQGLGNARFAQVRSTC